MNDSNQRRVAVCPGSYDPVTYGHLDILTRTSRVFDRVVVGVVGQSIRKSTTLFTAEERKAFLERALADNGLDNVEVQVFTNLLVEFARQWSDRDRQGPAGDLRLRVRVRDEPASTASSRPISSRCTSSLPPSTASSSTGVMVMATFGADVSDPCRTRWRRR